MFSVQGYDQCVLLASQAGQLELNVMMPIIAFSLLEAITISSRAIHVMDTRCIQGITAERDRMRKYAESTSQIATVLSPIIGYEKTAELVNAAVMTGQSVLELVEEKGMMTAQEIKMIKEKYFTLRS
jgi:aspartate ammonia-lyase